MGLIHVKPKLWDRDRYYKMGEAGILGADERTELIEGTVVPMSPQNPPHANHITLLTDVLSRNFGQTHFVRVQLPLDLGEFSQPEPDIALISRHLWHLEGHPTSADLIVEVAYTSLSFDRYEKASLYAKYGLPEYWLLDVNGGQLEVFRQPVPDVAAPFGFNYGHKDTLGRGDSVAPLFAPEQQIGIGELLVAS